MTDDQEKTRVAELEGELNRARKTATTATRAKNAFLANMSHEICTPMNAILGFGAMLQSSELTPAQREWVGYINSNGRALLDLISDILDLSQLEAGSLSLSPSAFNLPALIDEVMAVMRPRAQAQGLQFTATCASVVGGDWIGDARRLRQVLLNLIGNAVKFTERGGVELEVAMAADDSGRLRFTVRDTGIGMTPEVQQRLFTRFMQADESFTRRYGGTGLGLIISKALVNLMGGGISVESQPDTGTVISFTVALGRIQDGRPVGAPPEETNQPFRRWGHLRVLVAEDNAVNHRLIERQLRLFGLAAETVPNGRVALDRLQARAYDVVLMDVEMPEMDGLEATRWLRASAGMGYATPANAPVIALADHALEDDRARCLAAGMNDYLSKPTDLAALEASLGRVLPSRPE